PLDADTLPVVASDAMSADVKPIAVRVSRTSCGTSTEPEGRTSPTTWTRPVVTTVSTATRACGSSASMASRIVSEIASQILSGCPSVTDSLVNRRLDTSYLTSIVRILGSARRWQAAGDDPDGDLIHYYYIKSSRFA